MYDFKGFEGELKRNWPVVMGFRPSWYKMYAKFQATEIADAWKLYCNTRNSALKELLLGDVELRSDRAVLANFGTTSGSESTIERGTNIDPTKTKVTLNDVTRSARMAAKERTIADDMRKANDFSDKQSPYLKQHDITLLRTGSVLNDGFWWPFKNDAWVVGGIHGLRMFHLAMEYPPDNLLWDSALGRPRVLARELIGMHAAGYKRVAHFEKDSATGKLTEVVARRSLGFVFAPQSRKTAEEFTFAKYYDAVMIYTSLQKIKDMALKTAVPYDSYDYSAI